MCEARIENKKKTLLYEKLKKLPEFFFLKNRFFLSISQTKKLTKQSTRESNFVVPRYEEHFSL